MPSVATPDNSAVRVFIGGQVHDDWSAYDVDSDLLIPADAWHVSLSTRSGMLPAVVTEGAPVEVRVGDDLVMSGRIDEIDEEVTREGLRFELSGRDGAAVLVDCSSPIFVAQMTSLEDVVAKIVRPLGVTEVRIDAAAARLKEKVNVEPGDTAWDTLTHAAEANGLWPWFEPDGTLVIGGPNYDQEPVATLVLRRNGDGNNALSIGRRRSVKGRYSEMTVLGQKRGTLLEEGKHALKATERDTGVSWYRPRVVVDHECDSTAVCRDRARKLLSDSRLKGMTLRALVSGHRIVAPESDNDGRLWAPGQLVRVVSEPHGIDDVFFLMARRFTGGRNQSARTLLTLKENKTWVLDAHPHKRKHRLGKNEAPVQILDVSKGASQ